MCITFTIGHYKFKLLSLYFFKFRTYLQKNREINYSYCQLNYRYNFSLIYIFSYIYMISFSLTTFAFM